MSTISYERNGRDQLHLSNPLAAPFKAAVDAARDEAKNAWATFEKAREEAVKADPDLKNEEALSRLDTLYGEYTALAGKAEAAEERWLRALGETGQPDRPTGKAHGPSKVAESILDRVDAKARVQPAGAVIAPDLLDLIVDESLRDRSVLALYSRRSTTGDEIRYLQSGSRRTLAVGDAEEASRRTAYDKCPRLRCSARHARSRQPSEQYRQLRRSGRKSAPHCSQRGTRAALRPASRQARAITRASLTGTRETLSTKFDPILRANATPVKGSWGRATWTFGPPPPVAGEGLAQPMYLVDIRLARVDTDLLQERH